MILQCTCTYPGKRRPNDDYTYIGTAIHYQMMLEASTCSLARMFVNFVLQKAIAMYSWESRTVKLSVGTSVQDIPRSIGNI
jgi:hypothetical protein